MSVDRSKAVIERETPGTPGGVTYTVRMPGERSGRAICFRPIHGDPTRRCGNVAGYGTSHVGTGACKMHGGSAVDNPGKITTGRTAHVTRQRLDDKVQEYLNQDRSKLLDLTEELAFAKAIMREFLEKFPTPDDEEYGMYFHRFTQLIGSIGTLVEKINRIDSRNSLTTAQVLYLRATITDIFMKYLPDPDTRVQAAKELAARMGGDMSLNMQPSEVTMPKLTEVIDG